MWLILENYIHINLWAKHRHQERKNIFSFNWIFDEYSKSKLLAFLNQSIDHVYGNLVYDEDPLLHCLESTQHSWVLDPNYIKAQVVMVRKATWPPPWSHLVRLQNHHLTTVLLENTKFEPLSLETQCPHIWRVFLYLVRTLEGYKRPLAHPTKGLDLQYMLDLVVGSFAWC